MAISAAVFVGGIEPWKDALIEKAKSLHVGPGNAAQTDVGPLISPEAKARAERLIQSGADEVKSLSFYHIQDLQASQTSAKGSLGLCHYLMP